MSLLYYVKRIFQLELQVRNYVDRPRMNQIRRYREHSTSSLVHCVFKVTLVTKGDNDID